MVEYIPCYSARAVQWGFLPATRLASRIILIEQNIKKRTGPALCVHCTKYIESWPNTTSAWAGWSRFDIPVDRYSGEHSLLLCTCITLVSSTSHSENTYWAKYQKADRASTLCISLLDSALCLGLYCMSACDFNTWLCKVLSANLSVNSAPLLIDCDYVHSTNGVVVCLST